MRVALVTDSTSDLTPEQQQVLGIRVVPLSVHFKGRVFKDWEEITPAMVFEGVRAGAELPSTSQPTPQAFSEVYQEALGTADHVLSIHLSSRLSGTFQSAEVAAKGFPGKVSTFDTQAISAGIGMMVSRAQELLSKGAELDEVLVELRRIRDDHLSRFTVTTLEFLKRGGRIGGAQAFLGSLLNIKPILAIQNGVVEVAGRARGEKKALAEMVGALKHWGQGRRQVRIFYLYCVDPVAIDPLHKAVLELGPPFEQGQIGELGGVMATHGGPGTYGIYAYSL